MPSWPSCRRAASAMPRDSSSICDSSDSPELVSTSFFVAPYEAVGPETRLAASFAVAASSSALGTT